MEWSEALEDRTGLRNLVGAGGSDSPANAEAEDDWLNPHFIKTETEFDDLLAPLSPCGSDELGSIFESPQVPPPSMRTAFSLNDLQSLQSTSWTYAPPWSQQRVASVKPTLESVPEGGPSQSISLIQNPFEATMAPEGDSMSMSAPLTAAHNMASTSNLFSTASPHLQHSAGVRGPGCAPALAPALAPAPAPALAPALTAGAMPVAAPSTLSVRGRRSPLYGVAESPEHPMPDGHKAEACGDTDSSGNTSGNTCSQQLRPSGAALRKSQSALELGAWRKMAAGDMDFIDPSGSVREQLHGLEMFQQAGKLTPEERLQKILRYRAKRQMRNFNRTIKYQCRKSLADTRPRVRGRFARDNEPGSVLPHETKKALREKSKPSGKGQAQAQAQAQANAPAAPWMKLEHTPMQPQMQAMHVEPPPVAALAPAAPVAFIPRPPNAPPEHHATALAHLYNQWSEVTQLPPS